MEKVEEKQNDKKKIVSLLIQFIKFGMVGAINTILSYTITNVGYYLLNFHEQVCNVIAFIITVFISFILNRRYVFKKDKKKDSFFKSLFKVYVSYSITGLFLTAILLFIEEQLLGIPHYIATFINLIFTIPINFLLNKFWAFK